MADAARLHRAKIRKETGLTLLEGPHLITDAVRFGADVLTIFALVDDAKAVGLADASGAELIAVDPDALRRVADTESPRGPVAVIAIPDRDRTAASVVVLWELSDPGNAGTIVRTAAAFGFGVIMAGNSVDAWAPKVIRAGGGGHFATTIERHPDLSIGDLADQGLVTVAAVGAGGLGASDIPPGPVAILIGNEAHGLPPSIVESADVRFTIPMPGITESLNAAAAAAISLYAISNR